MVFDRIPPGWADLLFFSVQLALVFGIGQVLGVVGKLLIGLPLVAFAVERLRPWRQVLVFIALAAAIVVPIGLRFEPWNSTLANGLTAITAMLFVSVFAALRRKEQKTRERAERLMSELEEANTQLAAYAAQAEELAMTQERNRLAREIHDTLGHTLTIVNVQIEAARVVMSSDPARALDAMAEIESGIRAVYAKTGTLEGADPETARAVQAQMIGVIWTGVQEIRQNPVIAGKMLAFIGVVFLQMLLLGVGSALFEMPLGESPLALVAPTLALALASTGLGMAVGSVAQSRKQAGNAGMILGFVFMLGSGITAAGGYLSNPTFQAQGLTYYLALLTPNAHPFDGYVKLMLHSGNLVDILPNMLVLLGFGVVFFLIGAWRFKYE